MLFYLNDFFCFRVLCYFFVLSCGNSPEDCFVVFWGVTWPSRCQDLPPPRRQRQEIPSSVAVWFSTTRYLSHPPPHRSPSASMPGLPSSSAAAPGPPSIPWPVPRAPAGHRAARAVAHPPPSRPLPRRHSRGGDGVRADGDGDHSPHRLRDGGRNQVEDANVDLL